ncbi:type II secretion system protein [Candidatus Peregrinibacteria bacterium]|nr:MAG: type II secretion system protein [Candidatus Peregrinibacteria bacterium]
MRAIHKKGFSLVELLVVITIIAILSVVAYTAVGGQTVKARDAKRKNDLTTMRNAFEIYYNEYARYPASPLTNGDPAVTPGTIPRKTLSSIPQDPGPASTPKDYIYQVNGNEYLLAATLEGDGDPANYESFILTNSDSPNTLLSTTGPAGTPVIGYYYNTTTQVLTPCNNGFGFRSGPIATSVDGSNPVGASCVPYDPAN